AACADPAGGQPHARIGAPRDAATSPRVEAAGGNASAGATIRGNPAKAGRSCTGALNGGRRRHRSEAVLAADPADPGDAQGAGPGVNAITKVNCIGTKNAPVSRGVFVSARGLPECGMTSGGGFLGRAVDHLRALRTGGNRDVARFLGL